jgi:phosphatidylinositol-3-phosphatase
MRILRRILPPLLALAVLSGAAIGSSPAPVAAPGIGHVFVLVLENEDYDNSFGPDSPAPYLAKDLPAQGALLKAYYATGHYSLDNYISMISGQAPNPDTQADCRVYAEFESTGPTAEPGQARGHGCVYPAGVQTLANQLDQAGLSWKGYMEDMGKDPAREAASCAHPSLGKPDPTQRAAKDDSYATRHDPFMYFHAVIDDAAGCARHVVNLDALPADLADAARTPSFSFITPSLCHDGHDSPCADGEPGGLVSADAFLKQWVPRILAAPAFRKDGLLLIVFDESNGPGADSTACCGEGAALNTDKPGLSGPGGGLTGAVLLSPLIKPGTVSTTKYNHYSMLRSIEDLYGLPYLGEAGAPGQAGFGADVYSQAMPALPPRPQ